MAAKLKKGTQVSVIREKFENSLEARSSDPRFPPYLFDSKGEIVETEGDYALVKFYVPTPNIWFKLEHLEAME